MLVGQKSLKDAEAYKQGTRQGGIAFQGWYARKFSATPMAMARAVAILLPALDAALEAMESIECREDRADRAADALRQARAEAEKALNSATMAT
jgi:hypothetical protein